jgi:hypothetical protein
MFIGKMLLQNPHDARRDYSRGRLCHMKSQPRAAVLHEGGSANGV